LSVIAAGMLIVGVDVRLDAANLLPDTVGFVVLAWGAWRLVSVWWVALAVVGAVTAVPQWVLPHHYEQVEAAGGVLPSGTRRVTTVEVLEFDRLGGLRLAAAALVVVLVVVLVVAVVSTLHRRAGRWNAQATTRNSALVGVGAAALWGVPQLVAMGAGAVDGNGYDPVWNGGLWGVQLVGSLAVIAFAGCLFAVAREPWALPIDQPLRTRPTP
jgi:hypothetical protein